MAGVRRQLGLDARARLRRDLPRTRHRTGPARHLPCDQYEIDWMYMDGGASQSIPTSSTNSSPRSRRTNAAIWSGLSPAADQRRPGRTARGPPRRGASGKAKSSLCCRARRPSIISPVRKSRSRWRGSRTITWSITAGSKKASCSRRGRKAARDSGRDRPGRHDTCTPPVAAWKLKQAWPEVELISSPTPAICSANRASSTASFARPINSPAKPLPRTGGWRASATEGPLHRLRRSPSPANRRGGLIARVIRPLGVAAQLVGIEIDVAQIADRIALAPRR